MKIILSVNEANFDTASHDKVATEISLALKKSQEIYKSLRYWGKYGQKGKAIDKSSDLSGQLKAIKSGVHVLSDVAEGEASTELRISIRKELIGIQLFRDIAMENLARECAELQDLFRLLYADLKSVQFPLLSSIALPEIDYRKPRPAKRWRKFDPWGIVDFIKPSQVDFPDAKLITHKLTSGALPKGVVRHKIDEDMIAVDWSKMVLPELGVDRLLSQRSVWYSQNSEFEKDSDYNEAGDLRVDVFQNKKANDLTFYDAMTQTGFRAIGFDPKSQSYEEDKVKKLEAMLKKGKTSEGFPLLKAYVVVSKREFALHLKSALEGRQLAGVLYADDAGQLWNPFPEGLWLD
jgi:hypothetical protein